MAGGHMSDIFKRRKIPKHLIIREEYAANRKPRFNMLKIIFWGLVLLGLTWGVIVIQAKL
jgi:hypothetical protein